jgi:CDP-diacylglycerol--glycerol-3-phosphate 3-phosphatidyltransferase
MADKGAVKMRLRSLLDPVVAGLEKAGVTPLAVTIAGLALSLLGALFVARGSLRLGAVILIVAGICDTLDGSLARRTGRVSVFGAFVDSTTDRLAELAVFGALILYYMNRGAGARLGVIGCLVAIAGSFLTSYTRARAEGLGLECRVGWLERPERVALIIVGFLGGGIVLDVIVGALAVLTLVTTVQRVLHVRRLAAGHGGSRP